MNKIKSPFLLILLFSPVLIWSQAEDLREKIRQLENQVAVQNEKIIILEEDIKKKESEIENLETGGASDRKKARAYDELALLYEKRKKENDELKDLNKSLKKLTGILRREVKELGDENKILKEENKNLADENHYLKKENQKLKDANNNLKIENDTLNFLKNLRVVAMECLGFGSDFIEFSFVLISDGTIEKKQVPLIIFVEKKEKQNRKEYFLKHNDLDYLEILSTTQEVSRLKFKSIGEFSEKNDFLNLRNNNFSIAFFHRDDKTRKIIGEIKITNLENECFEKEKNQVKP